MRKAYAIKDGTEKNGGTKKLDAENNRIDWYA